MMASGSLPQSGGETRGPVSPDNVHETGVSPQWTLRISVETAEAQLVERTQKRPGHGPDPSFCTLQSLLQKIQTTHASTLHIVRQCHGSHNMM
jgi:hypothetical protein